MKKMRFFSRLVLGGCFFFFSALALNPHLQTASAALAKAGYDAFTQQMAYTPNYSKTREIAANFLTYPFELIRWPLNKTLVFIEEKRIPAKTKHYLLKLYDKGITPRLNLSAWGADFNLVKLARLSGKIPSNLIAKSWVVYGKENIFDTGLKLGAKSMDPSGFHSFGTIRYDNRPEEDFFGLGPNSSQGDEVSYKMETTAFEAIAGYNHEYFFNADLKFGYKNINISAAKDDDDPIIYEKNFNAERRVPGLFGENLLSVGTEVSWDPAPHDSVGATPGRIKLGLDFNEGLDNDARYFKFTADLGKNFELGSPQRVLAIHFYGEHNNDLPGHTVPFHQSARLGGFGNYPSISRTLRSYEVDRFYDNNAALFNYEYRYRVYEYRLWSLSHVLFLDQGQVFQRLKRFKMNDFRESYGTGFRLYYMNRIIFDFEAAHGDEGTVFHFKNRQPF